MNSLYKQALLKTVAKTALGMAKGKTGKFVAQEVGTRAAQKIPGVGLLAPESKLQKGKRYAETPGNVVGMGRSTMAEARKGHMPKATMGDNKDIRTASLRHTHEDMIELEKEARAGMPGFGTIFGGALATAGAGALLAGGIHGANKLFKKVETERIWGRLKKEHPDLTSTPNDRENFEVIQHFSPDLAGNVTTARSYLQRAQQTHMAPHEFVKDLTSIQDVRDRGSLGRRFEDIASNSIGQGMDYSKMQGSTDQFNRTLRQRKKANAVEARANAENQFRNLQKRSSLISAMNEVYE